MAVTDNKGSRIISVVGKAGSGKTTILNRLSSIAQDHGLSIEVIEVDKIGHQALLAQEVRKSLQVAFSNQIFDTDGSVNRKKLGEIVFSDSDELKKLNTITHPWIFNEVKALCETYSGDCIILEGAALIEIGIDRLSDFVIYFEASESLRKERLMKGRGMSFDRADRLVKVQKADEYFRNHADLTLNTEHMDDESYAYLYNIIRKFKKHEN